jgi:16S rRNA (guanine966-N2)-methyltransferase
MLAGEIYGSVFLDLFAGTGAIGIEALSRGAREAVFVENAGVSVIRENLARTRLSEQAAVVKADFRAALKKLGNAGRLFDIIFMDPPYNMGYSEKALSAIEQYGVLNPGGLVVAEQMSDEPPLVSDKLRAYKVKSYKTTRFTFLRYETDISEGTP